MNNDLVLERALTHEDCDYAYTPFGKNTYGLYLSWDKFPGPIWYQYPDEESGPDMSTFLHAFTQSTNPATIFVSACPLQTEVFSDASKLQIQDWLWECSKHKQCPQQFDAVLPKRVIEVAPPDCPHKPRIFITDGHRGKYVALSYCWGKLFQGQLKQSNLKDYCTGLDLHRLPQTIQDAIAVTRSLSIPYLWVDALCIIQDSADDKVSEISKMDGIYMDSFITITAACAENVTQGFLHSRSQSPQLCTIPFRLGEGNFGTISIGYLRESEYDENSEPINTRAWTLQEGLLAPRYLNYASHTLQWRCKAAAENLGYSIYPNPSSTSLYHLSQPALDAGEALEKWLHLVQVYSKRSATLSSDKLTAISALSKQYSSTLGSQYFAGIWSFAFLRQLAWEPDYYAATLKGANNTRPSNRPSTYRAPSWSWASVDGPICYAGDIQEETEPFKCQVMSCMTELKSAELPFGEVTGGILRMTCVLRQAWRRAQEPDILVLGDEDKINAWIHYTCKTCVGKDPYDSDDDDSDDKDSDDKDSDDKDSDDKDSDDKDPDDNDSDDNDLDYNVFGTGFDIIMACRDRGDELLPMMMVCLPLFLVYDSNVWGLLLQRVGENTFKRVGSFCSEISLFDHLPQVEITIL